VAQPILIDRDVAVVVQLAVSTVVPVGVTTMPGDLQARPLPLFLILPGGPGRVLTFILWLLYAVCELAVWYDAVDDELSSISGVIDFAMTRLKHALFNRFVSVRQL
jgi:hypothetical protein